MSPVDCMILNELDESLADIPDIAVWDETDGQLDLPLFIKED